MCITSFDYRAFLPIKHARVITTQAKAIVDTKAKCDRLVTGNRHIKLGNLLVNNSVYHIKQSCRQNGCKVEPCRNRLINSSIDTILAINSHSHSYVSGLSTLVDNSKLLQQSEIVFHELIRYAIPFCSALLLCIFNTFLKNLVSSFANSWIYQCRDSFCCDLNLSTEVQCYKLHQILL